MEFLIHDRVSRSNTRFNSLVISRWNPVRKCMESWNMNRGFWQKSVIIDTLQAAIKYKCRTVKWIHTWAEPTED